MGAARAVALGLLLLLGGSFLGIVSAQPQDAQTDIAALLSIKAALFDPRGILNNWLVGIAGAPCVWRGVSCYLGRVSELRLQGAGLQGPLAGTSMNEFVIIPLLLSMKECLNIDRNEFLPLHQQDLVDPVSVRC